MAELIWDGKYDRAGRRVEPWRRALPLQTVEEFATPAAQAVSASPAGPEPAWRNRLIWGDKRYVLPALLPEFAGQVNLVYVDPPFATGADFCWQTVLDGAAPARSRATLAQTAYRDNWGRGLDGYLQWFYETVVLLRDLLAADGSLLVHLDWRLGAYAKCILDEVFGPDSFRNELIWAYGGSARGAKAIAGQFPRNHDVIYWYSKGPSYRYEPQRGERRVHVAEATRAGFRRDADGTWFKTAPRGDYTDASIRQLAAQGRIYRTASGSLRVKYPLRQSGSYVIEEVLLGDVWTDIPDAMHLPAAERTGYQTQKPEALLARLLEATTAPGDLVLDCFVGAGTTAVVAEKLGRRWLAADRGRFAIHTTRKRLLALPARRPFVVQTLGAHERLAWQADLFGAEPAAREQGYRRFILGLYRTAPLGDDAWLHGSKDGRLVHVAPVAAAPGRAEIARIVAACRQAAAEAGRPSAGMDVLAWEFADEACRPGEDLGAAGDVRLVRIPREALEVRDAERSDLPFREPAGLVIRLACRGRTVTLEMAGYVVPVDGVPERLRRAVTHWAQWLDYWAVDWANGGDVFRAGWWAFRDRRRALALAASHTYERPGRYRIVVKAVDILGDATTQTLVVEVE